MAKDNKDKFRLNKGGGHNFDISKGGKHRFDLSKEDDDENGNAAPPVDSTEQTSDGNNTGKKNKWIWILAAVIVVALLALLLKPKSSEPQMQTAPDDAGQPAIYDETDGESSEGDVMTTEDTRDASQGQSDANEESIDESQDIETETVQEDNVPDQPSTQNVPETRSKTNVITSGDIEAEALKVIRGEYGDGNVRKDLLGDKYNDVQRRVNELKRQGVF